MGHRQPPTPIHCDNTTATGIVHGTIKKQRSRAMNMRYFWSIAKQRDKTIDVSWQPGKENLGDYVTKHHPPNIHQHVRPLYQHMQTSPRYLQRYAAPHLLRGCAKPPVRSFLHTPRLPYNSMVCIPTHMFSTAA